MPVKKDLSGKTQRTGRSGFRGEAINLETEEEIFYIPKSALYDSNMWGPGAVGSGSRSSWTPPPPGARLVTWRPDMNQTTKKPESIIRPRYQPITPPRSRLVTWVPRVGTPASEGVGTQ